MEHSIWSGAFWRATIERIIRTAAGALLALVIVDGFDLLAADWVGILSTVGLAALVSLLMAITSNAATKSGPALTDSEQVVPPEYVPERALNEDTL
jgi:hypothetical protein